MKDGNGTELEVGDIVNVPCVVRSVHHSNMDWNNVVVATVGKNFPGEYHTELHLNGKQLEFVSRHAAAKETATVEAAITAEAEVDEQHVMDSEPTWPSVGDATRKTKK